MHLENAIIRRFMQNAEPFVPKNPSDIWGWIFLLQHHRGLTRLLDWSESPLVALYFALRDLDNSHCGMVWCLDPYELNKTAGHERKNFKDILSFNESILENYHPDKVESDTVDLSPIAFIGPRNSARMAAQSGAFTIIHKDKTPIEQVGNKEHIWRFVIPANKKTSIREEIKIIGLNELMLFPDLERVAMHARESLE